MNALQENDMLVHVLLREVGRYYSQYFRRFIDYRRCVGIGLHYLRLVIGHNIPKNIFENY